MLQKHSCWPWVGCTLQVPQPGQVPSAPAGFVPFLMPLLYLSYIHSVTPPSVPTEPPIDSPTSPLTARATETKASSEQLCAPPAQSSTRHFHVPHSSLPLCVILTVLHSTFAATAQVVSLGSPRLMICTNSSQTLHHFSPVTGPASSF